MWLAAPLCLPGWWCRWLVMVESAGGIWEGTCDISQEFFQLRSPRWNTPATNVKLQLLYVNLLLVPIEQPEAELDFFLSHPPACKWAPCGSWFAPPQPWSNLRLHLGWPPHGVALCWVGGGARVFERVVGDKAHSPTMRLTLFFFHPFSWQWNEQRRGGWELFPACALKWAQHVWLHWLGAGAPWWARQNHEVDDNGLCAETRNLL